MDLQLALLFRLFAAHLLSDFALAPLLRGHETDDRASHSPRTYLHGLIAAALVYLLSGRWSAIWIIPVVLVVHIVSDLAGPGRNARSVSLLDQGGHLVVLLFIWFVLLGPGRGGANVYLVDALRGSNFWVVLVAYGLVFWPCGAIVGRLTERWRDEARPADNGLKDAGLWIGRLERVLVLTFVLLSRFEAIGFLIAAKSILRIGEVTGHGDRRQAEYILIGTMLSLLLAVAIGLATSRLL